MKRLIVQADDRPLGDLGLVQLAARLGASLERRRAQRAVQAHPAPAARPIFSDAIEDFDAAAAEEAARARADFFGGQHSADGEASTESAFAPAVESETGRRPPGLRRAGA